MIPQWAYELAWWVNEFGPIVAVCIALFVSRYQKCRCENCK